MSASLAILRVLSDGKPRTAADLSGETGLTMDQIISGMTVLRKEQRMRSRALPYVITDSGREWLAEREARAERVAARKIKRAVKTEAERLATEMARRQRSMAALRQRRAEAKAQLEAAGQMTWADTKTKFVHKRVAAPAVADSIVNTAVQSRPPLQAAWGAMA